MAGTIFSDSWFQVAGLRVGLLPNVSCQRQLYRDRPWYVLQDTYTQRFFRANTQTYEFIKALNPAQTIEQIWQDYLEKYPDKAPSQEEVIQLLSQLNASNLLYFKQVADSSELYARYHEQKQKERLGQIASFLYFRLPVWNPDKFLERSNPWIARLTSIPALLIWLLVVIAGGLAAFENSDAMVDRSQGLLALSNIPWLYVCLGLMKLVHETAHGFVCKRYGGEVRTFGLMFLLFTPLPYVDATSSWGFTNRWHRVYVSVAGMAVELFLAAIAALVWAHTGAGLINSLAFNVMIIGSVSSLLFNGNPLLRFDAYYMLSDYAGIPNLYQKAQQQWTYFGDRYILGTNSARSPASDSREWHWLTYYGFLSFIYMLIVTVGISLFLLDQWLPLGIFALAMTLFSKLVMPSARLWSHLKSSKTQANRMRALSTLAGIFLGLTALVFFVPLPFSVRAPGILEAQESEIFYTSSEGFLEQIKIENGAHVQKGDLIAQLSNFDVEQEIRANEHALEEVQAQYRRALFNAQNDIASLEQNQTTLQKIREDLLQKRALLTIRAGQEGEWVAPNLHEFQGTWIHRGQILGELLNLRGYRFSAVITQEQANEIFKSTNHTGELMLTGQSDHILKLQNLTIIPYQSRRLLSPALGWMGGGDIAVKTDDKEGVQTQEPFFVLHGVLTENEAKSAFALHGLSGTLRVSLPWEPLAWQTKRWFMQLLQKRYSI